LKETPMTSRWLSLLLSGGVALSIPVAGIAWSSERAPELPSYARVFAADEGIVDLMVTGPAAAEFFERLPGEGRAQACGGASGLHKGDGPMSCVRRDDDHSCHLWLHMPKQALTEPEMDEC
jgi:hypothetical protein